MSGSGGGGGGGYIQDFEVTCDRLTLEVQLGSPQQAVIDQIEIGATLEVAVQLVGTSMVVVVLHRGQVAGGIAHSSIQRLRECINEGTVYVATVLSKNGGQVRVRITPVRLV